MIYNTGRLMGPATRATWSELVSLIEEVEEVLRRLGLRPSAFAAARQASLVLAAARAELAGLYAMTPVHTDLVGLTQELTRELMK